MTLANVNQQLMQQTGGLRLESLLKWFLLELKVDSLSRTPLCSNFNFVVQVDYNQSSLYSNIENIYQVK